MKERLREGGGGRTIVVIGIVEPVGTELDLAVIELEVRGMVEADIGIGILSLSIHSIKARKSFLLETGGNLAFEFNSAEFSKLGNLPFRLIGPP